MKIIANQDEKEVLRSSCVQNYNCAGCVLRNFCDGNPVALAIEPGEFKSFLIKKEENDEDNRNA